jgi:AhpD family alkylhydroperoxidase
VKIRTSQINGCAFCLRLHTGDALEKGENPDRIAVLSGWEETGRSVPRRRREQVGMATREGRARRPGRTGAERDQKPRSLRPG